MINSVASRKLDCLSSEACDPQEVGGMELILGLPRRPSLATSQICGEGPKT